MHVRSPVRWFACVSQHTFFWVLAYVCVENVCACVERTSVHVYSVHHTMHTNIITEIFSSTTIHKQKQNTGADYNALGGALPGQRAIEREILRLDGALVC